MLEEPPMSATVRGMLPFQLTVVVLSVPPSVCSCEPGHATWAALTPPAWSVYVYRCAALRPAADTKQPSCERVSCPVRKSVAGTVRHGVNSGVSRPQSFQGSAKDCRLDAVGTALRPCVTAYSSMLQAERGGVSERRERQNAILSACASAH